jgi:hypothetical protein
MSDFIPKAIETEYNGYKFRSRLEARWAVVFDWLKVKYQYEPQGFELGDGIRYLPDFYLPEHKLYVEVKANYRAAEKAKDKLRKFAKHIKESGEFFTVLFDVPNYEVCIKDKYQVQYIGHGLIETCGLRGEPSTMFTDLKIDFYEFHHGHHLHCPRCGFYYTHLSNITPGKYENVSLDFTCENCSPRNNDGDMDGIAFSIDISNHKGYTYIRSSYEYRETNQLLILSGMDKAKLEDALHVGRTARFEHGEKPLTMQLPSLKNTRSITLKP